SDVHTTNRSFTSCSASWARAAGRWITSGARRAAKARASGGPNGARFTATTPPPTPVPRDAVRLTLKRRHHADEGDAARCATGAQGRRSGWVAVVRFSGHEPGRRRRALTQGHDDAPHLRVHPA